jgi:hypothetical protein
MNRTITQPATFAGMILLASLLSVAVGICFPQINGFEVEGDVTNDTEWMVANSPYEIIGNVTVAKGATLTIEPGVDVRFGPGSSLIINGSLQASGTSANKISFSSNKNEPIAGDWDGVKLYGDENSTLTMESCSVQHARTGVTIESLGRATIQKSALVNNSESGIHAVGTVNLLVRENTVRLNINGISTSGSTASGIKIIDNYISNNENGIFLYAYSDGSRISNMTVVGNTFKGNIKGLYIYSRGNYSVNANAYIDTVTISDNQMESNEYGIHLYTEGWYGGFIYNSAISNNTISFSKYALFVNSSSNWYSWISNVTVSRNRIYANGNAILMQAFHYPEDPFQIIPHDVILSDNVVSANTKGIHIMGDITVNFTNNSVAYNSYGLHLVCQLAPTPDVAHGNDIYQNTMYGVYVVGSVSIDAVSNYWGASSGPYHEDLNPSGEGDEVIGDAQNLALIPFSASSFSVVNNAPVAMLQVKTTAAYVNQTVNFDGSSSLDDGDIIKYFFDFGDGTTMDISVGVVRHAFGQPGVYNVSLIVMDDLGVKSINAASETVEVTLQSLLVSIWLNQTSVASYGQVHVEVHVTDAREENIEEVFVQLLSDQGGNFEPPSGYTDANGSFSAIFFAPRVSEEINLLIRGVALKDGYTEGSADTSLSVLLPSSGGIAPGSPWIWIVGFTLLIAIVAFKMLRGSKSKLKRQTSREKSR